MTASLGPSRPAGLCSPGPTRVFACLLTTPLHAPPRAEAGGPCTQNLPLPQGSQDGWLGGRDAGHLSSCAVLLWAWRIAAPTCDGVLLLRTFVSCSCGQATSGLNARKPHFRARPALLLPPALQTKWKPRLRASEGPRQAAWPCPPVLHRVPTWHLPAASGQREQEDGA